MSIDDATPEVCRSVDLLLSQWQDSRVVTGLHALVQANLASALLLLGNGNTLAPSPEALRIDAADIRYSADGLATFLERLADRVQAANN